MPISSENEHVSHSPGAQGSCCGVGFDTAVKDSVVPAILSSLDKIIFGLCLPTLPRYYRTNRMLLIHNFIVIFFPSNCTLKAVGATAALELNSFGMNLEVPEQLQVKLTNIAINLSQLRWLGIHCSVSL